MVPDVLILTQDTYYKKVAWFGADIRPEGNTHSLDAVWLFPYSKSFREISDSLGEFM